MSLLHVYFIALFDGKRSHPALDTLGGSGGPDTRCTSTDGNEPGGADNPGVFTNILGNETPFLPWLNGESHPLLDGYTGTGGPDPPRVEPDSMGMRMAENSKVFTNLNGDDPVTIPDGPYNWGPPSINWGDVCGRDYTTSPERFEASTIAKGRAHEKDGHESFNVPAHTAGNDGINPKSSAKGDGLPI